VDTARIVELLQPFLAAPGASASALRHAGGYSEAASAAEEPASFTQPQLQSISTYINLLLRWNARINLTAVRQPEEIVTRHFGESLFAARHLFPNAAVGTDLHPGQAERSKADWEGHGFSRDEKPPVDYAPSQSVSPLDLDSQGEPAKIAAKRRKNAAQGASPGSEEENEQALEGQKGSCETGALAPEVSANDQRRSANDAFADHLIDLGSGAGFPGLPIKLWAPHIHLTLIESNHKKAAFLREAARALTLTDVNVFSGRAENFQRQEKAFPIAAGIVTLRAVEHFDSILPTAARFVAHTGRLALLIGQAQVDRARQLLPDLRWQDPTPIPLSSTRVFLLGHR
jgi:16S rRNA (guanine(527)-N(7))-methyltransferase RsmG